MVTRSQRRYAAALFDSIDPMTPDQIEASRRAIADARFRTHMPSLMQHIGQGAFELTGLPTMHRGVGNIHQGVETGNLMQAAGGAGQMALGALPYGSGKMLSGLIPYASKYADWAANKSGLMGSMARRAPVAGGLVGGVEGTKSALDAGQANAAEMEPIPGTDDPRELQAFLVRQGYPIVVDGKRGPQTDQALNEYAQKYREHIAAQNSPAMQDAHRSLMQGQAEQAKAEAARLAGIEAERRGGVLKDAEQRYDERPRSWGQYATEVGQDWVGPAIMGAAAMAGVKGIPKAAAKRKSLMEFNKFAGKTAKTKSPTDAQKSGYVKTYDKAVKGTPIRDAAGTVGTYGVLGTEMALSAKYLDGARKQYETALTKYEAASAGGNLDGGREKELADAVVKAKRDVEKWERLQGAGLHAMGYYTAGKMGSSLAGRGGKPSAEATSLRNQFSREMKGPTVRQRLGGLVPKPRKPSPSGQGSLPSPQSGLTQKSTNQTRPSVQGGGSPKDQSTHQGPNPGSGQGGQGNGGSSRLSPKAKSSIREAIANNNGNLTTQQARSLAPNAKPEKLQQYLEDQKEALKKLGPEAYRKASPYFLGVAGLSLMDFDR